MTTSGLCQLKREDIRKVSGFLTDCFINDPLYLNLIPEEAMRKKVLPEFFECYLDMAFDHCEIYADSQEMCGIITVFDTSIPISKMSYLKDVVLCSLRFAGKAIRCDASMKTLLHFIRNIEFLTSTWEDDITDKDKVHIDFFAVKPEYRGKGTASKMMATVLEYADRNNYLTTVETHNKKNVTMYEHYGFRLFKTLSSNTKLREYCMVRS